MFTLERQQGRKYVLNKNTNLQIINDYLYKTGKQWRALHNHSLNLHQQVVRHQKVMVNMWLKKKLKSNNLGNYLTILHNCKTK